MILSVSRRTDIPAYFSDWFYQRILEGFVLTRNPMNTDQISKVSLLPDVIDGIVFWTKNPMPMMEHLHLIERYPYYFQFTLNPYDKDIECNLPDKEQFLVSYFQRLSSDIGSHRVIWRYDPILFTDRYSVAYHKEQFYRYAAKLCGFTEKVIVGFLNPYEKTKRNMRQLKWRLPNRDEKMNVLAFFSEVAKEFELKLETCGVDLDCAEHGIHQASCIDKELLERIGQYKLDVVKDKNQRLKCACDSSIDIGTYHTCKHGCRYCYANENLKVAEKNYMGYDSKGDILCGTIHPGDMIKNRKMKSNKIIKIEQLKFLD